MATLRNIGSGSEITLSAHNSVGRVKYANVRLSGEATSKDHATIRWNGDGWILEDRSRNGTRVNGRLLVGETVHLAESDVITFGDPEERWQLTDSSAPHACATRSDGQIVFAQNGVMLLPNEEEPMASLYAREGHWEVDVGGEISGVVDDQVIRVGDHEYRLDLPPLDTAVGRTVTLLRDASILNAFIAFSASADEEAVSVWLERDRTRQKLPDRTLNYMLLLLARCRHKDAANGIAPTEAGWIYTDQLAKQLNVTFERINVDVHRVRRAVGRLRVGSAPMFVDADRIIERRRTTTQIRLGVAEIDLAAAATHGRQPP
jgi:hypothetical protein